MFSVILIEKQMFSDGATSDSEALSDISCEPLPNFLKQFMCVYCKEPCTSKSNLKYHTTARHQPTIKMDSGVVVVR